MTDLLIIAIVIHYCSTCSETPLVPLKPFRVWAIIASKPNAECVHNGPFILTCSARWVKLWTLIVSLRSPIKCLLCILTCDVSDAGLL